jgi:hypothetical protein
MKFKLGQVVKDVVTGFEGVVTGRTEWLNGCVRYGVQSRKLKEGVPTEAQWFDEQQLSATAKQPVTIAMQDTGGPRKDPSRRGERGR